MTGGHPSVVFVGLPVEGPAAEDRMAMGMQMVAGVTQRLKPRAIRGRNRRNLDRRTCPGEFRFEACDPRNRRPRRGR